MLERKNEERIDLLLSGGGARAAHQVSALGAIAKLMPKNAKNPSISFPEPLPALSTLPHLAPTAIGFEPE